MCFIVFGNYQKAARILINAVHDAGANNTTHARQGRSAMIQECIDERACGVACGRVHDHADRLIDNDDVTILIYNIQWDIFGQRLGSLGLGECNFDGIALADLVVFGYRFAVCAHASLFDQARRGRTCYVCTFRYELVKACAYVLGLYLATHEGPFFAIIPHRCHFWSLPRLFLPFQA